MDIRETLEQVKRDAEELTLKRIREDKEARQKSAVADEVQKSKSNTPVK